VQRPPSPSGRPTRQRNEVEESLISLSRRLTNEPHVFVSSISTVDIVAILLRQYADLSEISSRAQQQTSQEIIQSIKAFKSDAVDVKQIDTANDIIDQIRRKIEYMEINRETTMAPIAAVGSLVERLFRNTGIKFGPRLSFGDAASAINSDALSAGEKQMLSFICYNAFYRESVIFIDEPELSLHVDWQRTLFPILQNQQSSNQFVIATHSPFIYGKYPDREININPDRGDHGA
jgi:predicted ATPase